MKMRRLSFFDKDITKQAMTILVFIAVALSLVVIGFGIYLLGDSSTLNQGSQIAGNMIKNIPNASKGLFDLIIEKIRSLI